MEKWEKLLEEIPIEIRGPVMDLKSDKHWAVLWALVKNDELFFDQLVEITGINRKELNSILKDLSGALIESVLYTDSWKIVYRLARWGRWFLRCLWFTIMSKEDVLKEIRREVHAGSS